MKCPICGRESLERTCSGCGRSLEAAYALAKVSGRFYNEGLSYAKEHSLEHARIALKKAIVYNPGNIQARNLLGLVYMETGEAGLAVREWMQSTAREPEGAINPAVDYLKRISKNFGRAAQIKEAVRLYNQALELLKKGQMDTALLHLKKAVAQSEHYVRARNLLALCYMEQRQFPRAAQLLRESEQLDREDPMLPYLRQLYRTSKEEWESSREGREAEEEERGRQEEPEEIPAEGKPLISGNSPKRSVRTLLRQNASVTQFLLFVLGMAVGLMFMGFLIMPAQMSVLQRERSDLAAQVASLTAAQNSEDGSLIDLQKQLASLGENYGALQSEYTAYQNNLSALLRAVEYYHQQDMDGIRNELSKVRSEKLSNDQQLVYDWLASYVSEG